MTALSTFYTLISGEIRRGTSLDYLIPGKVQSAVKWFEREHTFLYQDLYQSVVIPATGTKISVPSGYKKVNFWRVVLPSTVNAGVTYYSRITKIDPTDQNRLETQRPKGYWEDGTGFFHFDSIADQQYTTDMWYTAYTIIGEDIGQALPTVLDTYGDVILAATMVLFAPNMRDTVVAGLYKGIRDELVKSAIDADVEARQSSRSESMQYGWEAKEDVDGLNLSGKV